MANIQSPILLGRGVWQWLCSPGWCLCAYRCPALAKAKPHGILWLNMCRPIWWVVYWDSLFIIYILYYIFILFISLHLFILYIYNSKNICGKYILSIFSIGDFKNFYFMFCTSNILWIKYLWLYWLSEYTVSIRFLPTPSSNIRPRFSVTALCRN